MEELVLAAVHAAIVRVLEEQRAQLVGQPDRLAAHLEHERLGPRRSVQNGQRQPEMGTYSPGAVPVAGAVALLYLPWLPGPSETKTSGMPTRGTAAVDHALAPAVNEARSSIVIDSTNAAMSRFTRPPHRPDQGPR